VVFRCVEGFEEPVRSLSFETNARIFHAKAHAIPLISFGSDQQLPRTIVDGTHGVRSIPKEVQNDLLELNAITCDWREIISKFRL